MKILLLGSNGNLGRTLKETLLDCGHAIYTIDRSPSGQASSRLVGFAADRGCHSEITSLLRHIGKVDVAVDLSGFKAADVAVVLENLSAGIYMFMSSTAVASTCARGAEKLPIREMLYPVPSGSENWYAREKSIAEHLIAESSRTKSIILRSAEIIGSCDARERYFLRRVYSSSKDILLPDGCRNTIHPVDVRDVCRAIQSIMEDSTVPSGIYQLAGHTAIRLSNYIAAIYCGCDKAVRTVSVPWQFVLSFKPNAYFPFFPRNTVVDTQKMALYLNYEPIYDFPDSILRSNELFFAYDHTSLQTTRSALASRFDHALDMAEERMILEVWARRFTAVENRKGGKP